MKLYQYKYGLMVLSMLVLNSCKKEFLDVVPKGQLVAETTADYNLLMNNSDLYVYDFAGGWQAMAMMGDDVSAEESYFNSASPQSQNAFNYMADIYRAQDPTFDVNLYMSNLYLCNKVINEIDASKGGTTEQKKELKSEALANRAWIYFQLINTYGKPFSAATSDQDPGFPIIKVADLNHGPFTRGTVSEVYEFIISDFKEAIQNLPSQQAFATRFSRPAAEGLLAKV